MIDLIPDSCRRRNCDVVLIEHPEGAKYGAGHEIRHGTNGLIIPACMLRIEDEIRTARVKVAYWADGCHALARRHADSVS